MTPCAVFLFDLTGIMAEPWVQAGFVCYLVDLQHPEGITREGNIVKINADLRHGVPSALNGLSPSFVVAFPPCDHVATSGARWFKGKGLRALSLSIDLFATAAEYCEASGAAYMIENPRSTISTYWRAPDFTLHPWQYAHYAGDDNYSKETWLWTGGGFRMPDGLAVPLAEPDDRIHRAVPGAGRKNFRSATPRGFSRAVFEANAGLELV